LCTGAISPGSNLSKPAGRRERISQRSAAPVLFSARGTPPSFAARPERLFAGAYRLNPKCARARGTPRVQGALKLAQCAQTKMLGPTGLATSRQRGVSKSVMPQVRQTQGVPRAVFLGLLRSAPGGLTFQAFSCSRSAYPPLKGPGRAGKACDRPPMPAITGPGDARCARRDDMRLGPPGRFAASPAKASLPGHRSPPRI
jgi:hypothetical protein